MKQPRNKSGQFAKLPVDVRFGLKVGPEDAKGCWPWTGAINEWGYGTFWLDGKMIRAHRISWHLTGRDIPEGVLVLHSCDNPKCVNPHHLFLGTPEDNMRDMARKGRTNTTKLTAIDVKEIRRLDSVGARSKDLARMFYISYASIRYIVNRQTWHWV